MRKPYLFSLLLVVPAAFVWACSGDNSSNGDGGTDATTDTLMSNTDSGGKDVVTSDTGADATGKDGGASDAAIDVQLNITCVQPANCVDGGDTDAAYPPADAGVVCCGTIDMAGTFPSCNLVSATTACAAPGSCASAVSTSSCGSVTLRACKYASECVETGFDKCCTFPLGDAGSAHLCANNALANFVGGSCP